MSKLSIINDRSLVIQNGKIVAFEKTKEILSNYDESKFEVINASGKTILPDFIDSHTHFLFNGYRVEEFISRLKGKNYLEIIKQGGGILSTVKSTRKVSMKKLFELGKKRLDSFLSMGVTTIEGKSGYGLDFDTEIKQLKTMKLLNSKHSIDIKTTFLGAHAIPLEYKNNSNKYIDYIIKSVLPFVIEKRLAEFCDIFCENSLFSIKQSKKLLLKAKEMGMKLKIHADEFGPSGGAELASEIGAISADHLLNISKRGIKSLANNGPIAVLLPGSWHSFLFNPTSSQSPQIC